MTEEKSGLIYCLCMDMHLFKGSTCCFSTQQKQSQHEDYVDWFSNAHCSIWPRKREKLVLICHSGHSRTQILPGLELASTYIIYFFILFFKLLWWFPKYISWPYCISLLPQKSHISLKLNWKMPRKLCMTRDRRSPNIKSRNESLKAFSKDKNYTNRFHFKTPLKEVWLSSD